MSTEAASVLAQCVASPDDDTPRLVWADLVGGERGEFVVVQCNLARGDLSPEEIRVRRERERELLELHGVEWAGETARRAKRWSFHRGFIEAAQVELDFTPLDEPLLRWLTVHTNYTGNDGMSGLVKSIEGRAPLQGLALFGGAGMLDGSDRSGALRPLLPRLEQLRSFGCDNQACLDFVAELLERAPIEQLAFREPLELQQVDALILAAPELTALAFQADLQLPPALFTRPLRALHVDLIDESDLEEIAATLAGTLEHLGCQLTHFTPDGWRAFAALEHLRTLEVCGELEYVIPALLDDRVELPALETLVVRSYSPDAASRLADKFGARFYPRSIDDEPRLLHRSSRTSSGIVCVPMTEPVVLVDLLSGQLHELPSRETHLQIYVGRRKNCDLQVNHRTVARTHCALFWRDRGFVIRDLASGNSTFVDDQPITEVALCSGDVIGFGTARFAYFCGRGVDARARATAADAVLRDPISGLLRRTPQHQLHVVGWRRTVYQETMIVANRLFRALACELASELAPGEELSFVAMGRFGIEPPAASARLAATPRRTFVIDGKTIEIEIELVHAGQPT